MGLDFQCKIFLFYKGTNQIDVQYLLLTKNFKIFNFNWKMSTVLNTFQDKTLLKKKIKYVILLIFIQRKLIKTWNYF